MFFTNAINHLIIIKLLNMNRRNNEYVDSYDECQVMEWEHILLDLVHACIWVFVFIKFFLVKLNVFMHN
jgi:hypothetical protein